MKIYSRKQQFIRLIPLIVTFIGMCVLRLWFTLLVILAIAGVTTFLLRKKRFCADLCPLGALQDAAWSPKDALKKQKSATLKKYSTIQKILLITFWLTIIVIFGINWKNPEGAWGPSLLVMGISAGTALSLQAYYRKRAWCSYFCPVGSTLSAIVTCRK